MINYDTKKFGGKGSSLLALKEIGIPTPNFIVLPSDARISNSIKENYLNNLNSFISKSNAQYFAVRSSATLEDGDTTSFAGIFETYLYVTKSDILDKVNCCYQSLQAERVTSYCQNKGIDNNENFMAIVIQEMITPTSSGVLFTRSPDIDDTLLYIEAGIGLGEGVVSGKVEVDRYYVTRFNEVIKSDIVQKSNQLKYCSDKKEVILTKTDQNLSKTSVLDEEQIELLCKTALKLEKHYKIPCDIEWSFINNKLYILQCRPITMKHEDLSLFIDTNLSESYPGFISPMGGEFVNEAYYHAHKELGQYIGFSTQKLKQLDPYLKTMTNNISGHMYYDVNSYYNILTSIPGGRKNLENWHRMIGGDSNIVKENHQIDTPDLKDSITYYKFLVTIITDHKNIFNSFLKSINLTLESLYKDLNAANSVKDKILLLNNSFSRVEGFSLTAFNDVLTMKGLGLLAKIFTKYNYSQDLIPTLLKTEDGVESLEPLFKLKEICQKIDKESNFLNEYENLIQKYENESLFSKHEFINKELTKSYPEITDLITNYLNNYGDRSFEELKLESLTLKQSPQLFLDIIKLNLNSGDIRTKSKSDNIGLEFSFIDNLLVNFISKKTQRYIETREACRLKRGQTYGFIRICLISIFEQLKDENQILKNINTEDFFYLTKKDLNKFLRGNLNATNLKVIIEKNITNFAPQSSYPEKLYLNNSCDNAYFVNPKLSQDNSASLQDGDIPGLMASPGEIIGKALVIKSPLEATQIENLNDYILVTENTDPAWIYIMTQCKGLVSEKGSLLSHTAIIGRELSIPTFVAAKKATKLIQTGDLIKLNNKTSVIQRLQ